MAASRPAFGASCAAAHGALSFPAACRLTFGRLPFRPLARAPPRLPQNRDRLELYALHKQSIAGDAPPHDGDVSLSSNSSGGGAVAERSKRAAWRAKRGMTRDVAMARYVEECER